MLIDVKKRRYIGSADAGPILAMYRPEMASLAKYQSAADVWLRVVHDIKQPSNPRMERGLREEPGLRELYRTTVGPCSEAPGVIVHPLHEWACGSPDSFLDDGGILELKTTVVWSRNSWGEPGTDKVPDSYNVQTQWQMECAGREWCRLLVAFGSDGVGEKGESIFTISETAIYGMERNAKLCAALVECGQRFWLEHCVARTAPGVSPNHNKREYKRLQNERRGDEYVTRFAKAGGGAGEGTVGDGGSSEGQDEPPF